MFFQPAGDSNGTPKGKHKPHLKWNSELQAYSSCLFCRDEEFWGKGYDDGDVGLGYNSFYGYYGSYGDIYYCYGDFGYGPGEDEEKETIRISNVPDPGEVSNGHCELGIMAVQLKCSMDELWSLIDEKLAIWYPRTSVNTDYYPLPSGVAAGANYDNLSYQGQRMWYDMQTAEKRSYGIDENGNPYMDVIPGIDTDLLDMVSAMISAPGTSNVAFDPETDNNDVISAIGSDEPYYTSLDRASGNIALGHSVAIVGYTKGIITGRIYTYIIKDFVSREESEIPASSF